MSEHPLSVEEALTQIIDKAAMLEYFLMTAARVPDESPSDAALDGVMTVCGEIRTLTEDIKDSLGDSALNTPLIEDDDDDEEGEGDETKSSVEAYLQLTKKGLIAYLENRFSDIAPNAIIHADQLDDAMEGIREVFKVDDLYTAKDARDEDKQANP